MLVSHKKKFIYLKTRKTAGTSVEVFFERFCVPDGARTPQQATPEQISEVGIVGSRMNDLRESGKYYNHLPAATLRVYLGSDVFDRYFKFCVMRNPFDKVVSHFWFAIPDETKRFLARRSFSFTKEYFTRYVEAKTGRFNDRNIFMIDNKPVVDFFIRYESLKSDLEKVSKMLGVENNLTNLANYKSGNRIRNEEFEKYYNKKTLRLVEKEFEWELGEFSYKSPVLFG